MSQFNVLKAFSKGTKEQLLESMSGLSEKECAKFAKLLVRLERATWDPEKGIDAKTWEKDYAPYLDGASQSKANFKWQYYDLALLGTGNATQVRSIRLSEVDEIRYPDMLQILRERKPAWLDTWLVHQLRIRRGAFFGFWELVYPLISEGICEKPDVEGYYRLLFQGVGGQRNHPTISGYLQAHPDLLEDVWKLFDYDIDGFLDHPKFYTYTSGKKEREQWGKALHVLSDKGLLDRGQLLDTCLSTLQTASRGARLTAVARYYDLLAPTPEESAARQSDYVSLLVSSQDRVAKPAMTWLKTLEKAKALDVDALVRDSATLFAPKSKGIVADGLKLLERVMKQHPKHTNAILSCVAEHGVIHEQKDVQEQALAFLVGNQDALNDTHRAVLAERIGEMAPSLQVEARALTGVGDTINDVDPVTSPEAMAVQESVVGEIPEPWRTLAGIDAAIEAAANNTMPPALSFDIMEVPVTTAAEVLAPVATPIGVVEFFLGGSRDTLDMERALDGMSRLKPEASDEFDRLAASFVGLLRGDVPQVSLMRCWLTRGESPFALVPLAREMKMLPGIDKVRMPGYHLEDSLEQRIVEIGERVQQGVFAPMLSLPTHRGGWILPSALVERVNSYIREKTPIPRFDLILALLRLAPEGRPQAAHSLEASDEVGVRALRWTLTGEGGGKSGDDPAIWLAAARSRAPFEDMNVPGVDTASLEGPDGAHAVRYSLMDEAARVAFASQWEACLERGKDLRFRVHEAFLEHRTRNRDEADYRHSAEWIAGEYGEAVFGDDYRLVNTSHGLLSHRLHFEVTNGWSKTVDYEARPTIQLNALGYGVPSKFTDFLAAWIMISGRLVWPLNSDPGFMAALISISTKLEKKPPKNWPEHTCLENLHEPDRPISLLGATLMLLSLSAPPGDLQRAAIDVMVAAIEDGRAHPDILAPALIHLNGSEYLDLKRLADGMVEVAEVSPQHAWVMASLTEACAASWTEHPTCSHVLLDPLLEWKTMLGQGLSPEARKTLESLKGTGKAVKAVKQLLVLKEDPKGAWLEVPKLMLAARIARAERWAGEV